MSEVDLDPYAGWEPAMEHFARMLGVRHPSTASLIAFDLDYSVERRLTFLFRSCYS